MCPGDLVLVNPDDADTVEEEPAVEEAGDGATAADAATADDADTVEEEGKTEGKILEVKRQCTGRLLRQRGLEPVP